MQHEKKRSNLTTTEMAATMSTLDDALHYATLGFHVIPIKPGQKHPGIPDWQNIATDDPDTIRSWWTGPYTNYGIGIAPRSLGDRYLFVIDIDEHDPAQSGSDTLAALETIHGELPETVTCLTPSGGRHLYYYAPHPILNDQSGKLGAGIDIRGIGGQVLCPPTIHPEQHKPYLWELDREPGVYPIGYAPQWLLDMLTPSQPVKPVRIENRGIWDELDDSPAARYNASTTWQQLLEADGWTHLKTDRNGEQHWTRPGKDTRTGTSATVGYDGRDMLRVFTSSLAWLPEGAYSRFGYTACSQHGGDRQAFARTLISQPEAPIMTATAVDEPWPPIIPLHTNLTPPAFPKHVLPTWITNHTQQIADDIQVTYDLPANLALGALSICTIGNTTIHYPRQRWTQPLNLYIAVALPPSAGKSPAKNAIFRPLEEYEQEKLHAAKQQRTLVDSDRKTLEKRLRDLEDKKARATGPTDEIDSNRYQTILDLANMPNPPAGRLLVDDATTEALGQTLADNGGAIAVVSAEGGLFDRIAGMYSDGTANLDLYLEAWSGGRYIVDRIKRESIQIPNAHLCITTTIQPQTLDEIGARKQFAGRGLTARFLLTLPQSNVGTRNRLAHTTGNTQDEQLYNQTIISIARQHQTTKTQLTINDEASDMYANWDQHLENQLAPDQPLEHLAEWVGKLRANVLRLAGLLHIAWHQPGTSINHQTMADAIQLGNYYLDHMLTISDRWGVDETTAKTKKIVDWICRTKPASLTIRDLMRHNRRLLNTADETIPILQLLMDKGYIRANFDGPILLGQRGKTPQEFTINPTLCDARQMSPNVAQPNVVHVTGPANVAHVAHVTGISEQKQPQPVDNYGQPVDNSDEMSRMSRMSPKGGIEHSLSSEEKETKPPTPGDMGDMDDISIRAILTLLEDD
jgi:replicative DNA helicase